MNTTRTSSELDAVRRILGTARRHLEDAGNQLVANDITHALERLSVISKAQAEPVALIEIADRQARTLAQDLTNVLNSERGLYAITLDPRPDGVAVKINEGMWTPTMGSRRPIS